MSVARARVVYAADAERSRDIRLHCQGTAALPSTVISIWVTITAREDQ
jgi:hypothetical protein